MARIREIRPGELPSELRDIHVRHAGQYGPFGNQVAAFAHVPAALRDLMPMRMALRDEGRVPRR